MAIPALATGGLGRAWSQPLAPRQIPGQRVTAPPRIDGNLDDACWPALPKTSGFIDERLGTPVADDTTVTLGYDAENIYIAMYCHDRQPRDIVAQETKRGAGFRGEDRVRVRLNPFNSRRGEDESTLSVNPLGTQTAQIAGGHTSKQEWEGEWRSAARIVADGWTAEIAVPWRTFTRPAGKGRATTVGINFERYQARTDINSYWSNLGPQRRHEMDGQWTGVEMPEGKPVNPLSILAYTYGGYEAGTSVERAGLDARYQATPLLTGLATLNPDLSNVEGSVTSIDFSYSEQLPEEKRPFFLEGRGYFSSGMNGVDPFTSVRIPAFDVGGKFYGRVGESTDMGFLTTRNLGNRRDSVLTLSHALSPFDTFSLQSVSLIDPQISNQAYSGKLRMRRGDWNGEVAFTHTRDEDSTVSTDAVQGDAGAASVNWAKNAWYAWGALSTVGRNVIARDGYVPFVDQRGGNAGFRYNNQWRTGRIRDFGWSLNGYHFTDTDGGFFRNGLSTNVDFRTDKQLSMWAGASAGRYEENRDHTLSAGFRFPALNKFRNYGMRFAWGKLDGASYANLSPSINWRFFDRLSVGLSVEMLWHTENQHQDVLSVAYDLSHEMGLGGRLVNRNGKVNGYLSFRRSGYGGTEAFLIIGDPNADSFTGRAVVKLVRPL